MSQAALNRCAPREESASLRPPVVPLRAAGGSFYRPELDVLRFFALAAGVDVRSQMFEESPEIYLVFTLIL
jgi:hypothetical protein